MPELRYTLVTDGSSDTVLGPIVTWTLRAHGIECAIQPQWADLRLFSEGTRLDEKLRTSLEYYPCDILFIHRDAEREPRREREGEIRVALDQLQVFTPPPVVCVIPVRMQEAWLLFDESAIRHAAGNRNGQQPLHLPPLNSLESIPDPKRVLHDCLKKASGRSGRRFKKFRPASSAHQIPNFVKDFSPLRSLTAFEAFENELGEILRQHFPDKLNF